MVVDDDDGRRNLLARLFTHEGYEVDTLGDGEQVVDHVRATAPDLIVLDVMLPGVSGFELCGDLRMLDEARLTPIILITAAYLDEEDVVRGLLSGADDYVCTPARVRELSARVRVQLRNRRDRELLRWATLERASLRDAATRDALTGIGNRRVGERGLDEALSQPMPFVVMLIDVDHFKAVNDTHGHASGDVVLKRVAKSLASQARASDTVARFGGEEFLVIAANAEPANAFAIAERYRLAIERVVLRPDVPMDRITASVGVASWDGVSEPPRAPDLLRWADEALYAAKRGGRNRVVVAECLAPPPEGSEDTK